jgi:hypothetical protein
MKNDISQENLKKAIETIEQINHSGSGRVAGIEAEAVHIRVEKDSVKADVIIKGPREGQTRTYENLAYNYERIMRVTGEKNGRIYGNGR